LEGTFDGRAELPLEGLSLIEERLARGREELDALWLEAVGQGMQEAYELRRSELLPVLLGARQYRRADELFAAFQGELEQRLAQAPPSLREAGATSELRAGLRRDRLEIRRLVGMIELAAVGVRFADGELVELEVLPIGRDGQRPAAERPRGVTVPGRLSSGPTPLADGFRLLPQTPEPPFYLLRLDGLYRADLERFFLRGLESKPERDVAQPWLERTLLRFHEGDWNAARKELIGAGRPDLEGDLAELVEDLRARLSEASPSQLGDAQRAARILEFLGSAGDAEALERRDPSGAAAAIEILLERFAAVPAVGLNRPGLQARLEGIRADGGA
jgi:hypothetical protein